jgi:hypothetical protein
VNSAANRAPLAASHALSSRPSTPAAMRADAPSIALGGAPSPRRPACADAVGTSSDAIGDATIDATIDATSGAISRGASGTRMGPPGGHDLTGRA